VCYSLMLRLHNHPQPYKAGTDGKAGARRKTRTRLISNSAFCFPPSVPSALLSDRRNWNSYPTRDDLFNILACHRALGCVVNLVLLL
jgi:hypothetical protein